LRLGILGAGAIAERHLAVLRSLPEAEIAAVCDLDADRAGRLAEETGAMIHTDWRAMLDAGGLDAVLVCTPPAAHAEPAIAAMQAGLSVYLEKPLARRLEDGRAIVEAWRATGAVCNVGYQWRSLDVVEELRRRLAGSPVGLLVSRAIANTEGARNDRERAAEGGTWFVDPRQSGGILFELGSHDVDLQVALAGPVESVQAESSSGALALAGLPARGLDDVVALLIRFQSGCLGVVVTGWTEVPREPIFELDAVAPGSALHLHLDPVFRLTGMAGEDAIDMTSAYDPRVTAVERFVWAVEARDPGLVPCTPADALSTLATLLAAERAIADGGRVAVAEAGVR
jgi:myo-inositol 2-dehydrogenase / D-chiro-inositol 1-dehydrogenase